MGRREPPQLFDRRLLVVSGKGGTGKTTVAAACAMAAARTGRKVLLAEVEGRDGLAEVLGIEPAGFHERPTRFGFSVLSITPRDALLEYLWLFFGMRALARTLGRARVLEVVTDGVPGFRDLMTAGKLYELSDFRWSSEAAKDRPRYDLVVVDAPPTGQLMPLLRAPTAFRDMIRVGRPHRQMASIDRLFRTGLRLVLVALPEEMSVAETEETVAALAGEGHGLDAVVANRVYPPPFPKGTAAAGRRLNPAGLAATLREVGVEVTEDDAAALVRAAGDAGTREASQRRQLARLDRLGSLVRLPQLFSESFGSAQVERLAAEFGA